MLQSLNQYLLCPFCNHTFSSVGAGHPDGYGILQCECSEFPIISGIAIIQKENLGAESLTAKYLCNKIRAGEYQDALISMLSPNLNNLQVIPAWMRKLSFFKYLKIVNKVFRNAKIKRWRNVAATFFNRSEDDITVDQVINFYFESGGTALKNTCDYFKYRFGQPRHLVSLSLSTMISSKGKPILDLACGMGHITRGLVNTHPNQVVIGIDKSFFYLYLAKRWIAPKAEYVYCNADLRLPFADDYFSAVLCSNSFHFFHNKSDCINELQRIISYTGIIIFTAVRHELYKYPNQRTLSISEYDSLLKDIPHRLVSDSCILERYLEKKGPSLKNQADLKTLEKEPFISIIASHKDDVLVDHDTFQIWPHSEGRLSINPLFARTEYNISATTLVRYAPSEFYKCENDKMDEYIPGQIIVSNELLEQLPSFSESSEIEDLVSKCVLLDIPEQYVNIQMQKTFRDYDKDVCPTNIAVYKNNSYTVKILDKHSQ